MSFAYVQYHLKSTTVLPCLDFLIIAHRIWMGRCLCRRAALICVVRFLMTIPAVTNCGVQGAPLQSPTLRADNRKCSMDGDLGEQTTTRRLSARAYAPLHARTCPFQATEGRHTPGQG